MMSIDDVPTNDANGSEQPLLGTETNQISYNTTSSSDSWGDDVINTAPEEEADEGEISKPWPATYERSAEILAKPIVGRELVAKATESIHILSPTKLRKNVSLHRTQLMHWIYVLLHLSYIFLPSCLVLDQLSISSKRFSNSRPN